MTAGARRSIDPAASAEAAEQERDEMPELIFDEGRPRRARWPLLMVVVLIVMGIVIARQTDLFAAAMMTGIFSLVSAGLFTLMDAVDVAFTESTTLRRILDTAEILVLPADIQGIGTEDRGFDPECPTRDRSETAGRCMEILEFAGRDQEVVAIEMDTTTRDVGQAGANRHTTP